MLENKKLNMVISLLIAIALWAFVIGEVNPEASRTYREVPIRFINQNVLEENNMAVYSTSQRTINVTLRGTRSEINKIDSKDITATVDLAEAVMGENHLRVTLRVPSKVEIESQSVERIIVTVETRVSKEVPIDVSYDGTFDGEEEPITLTQSLSTVTVYGAESKVEQVAAACAVVPENTVTGDVQEVQCELFAVSNAGQRIYNVKLSDSTVVITSELAKLRTVPLYVPMHGKDSDGVERTVTVPKDIIIKGKAKDLEGIDSISTEMLYLEDVLSDTIIPLVPLLPEGVDISEESPKLEAAVTVSKIGTQTLSFDQTNVELRGLEDGFTAEALEATIELVLTGSESMIEGLSKDNITLFVDLSGLHAGKHKVTLQAICDTGELVISINPKKITVVIKEEISDDDVTQPEENEDADYKDDQNDQTEDNEENEKEDNNDNDNDNQNEE